MPTVLEKAVLLDETGQEIVSKLDDIKDAIGTSAEFIPLAIRVTTPPTKTTYIAGETLNLTGIVVNLIASNGVQIDVTSACTFSPANGATLTGSDTSVSISYLYQKDNITFTTLQALNIMVVDSIEVTTPPTTTEYTIGDTLDLSGIVVKANIHTGSQMDITNECVYSPADGAVLTSSNITSVNISWKEYATTQSITVVAPIYGVEWDGTSSSAFTRTDLATGFVDPVPYYAGMTETPSSPFDNIMPWAGMVRVTDAEAGELVAIPKFYYKLTQSGSNFKVQISSVNQVGFNVSPAHIDRGDGQGERDVVYIGRYHCGSNYKSVTGVIPKNNTTRADFRTNIHNLGSDIWQNDFTIRFTIWLLYLVEFADWNAQNKIGYGLGSSYSNTMGYTDSMPYHTGTTQTNKSTQACGTQYRNIEGLWDIVGDWIDGLYCGTYIYLQLNPANFADSETGVVLAYNYPPMGIPTELELQSINYQFNVFLPSNSTTGTQGTGNTTYLCDTINFRAGGYPIVWIGGNYNGDSRHGLFHIEYEFLSRTDYDKGSRLMKLPANS